MYFFLKVITTALVVAGVSELAKRYSFMAAALASLPLTSILAFIWTYQETKDTQKVIDLSNSILWLILPSALFFIVFPLLLKAGFQFYVSLTLSCAAMFVSYGIFYAAKKLLGA